MLVSGRPKRAQYDWTLASCAWASGPCTVFGPDVKVLISSATGKDNDYYYPDCTLSCDVADRRRGNRLIRSPRIVFEVLSPGTEKDDRGIKLQNYQQLETMEQVVLVSQFAPHVEVWTRVEESENWTHTMYGPGQRGHGDRDG